MMRLELLPGTDAPGGACAARGARRGSGFLRARGRERAGAAGAASFSASASGLPRSAAIARIFCVCVM